MMMMKSEEKRKKDEDLISNALYLMLLLCFNICLLEFLSFVFLLSVPSVLPLFLVNSFCGSGSRAAGVLVMEEVSDRCIPYCSDLFRFPILILRHRSILVLCYFCRFLPRRLRLRNEMVLSSAHIAALHHNRRVLFGFILGCYCVWLYS